jgi:hypothetical protein
LQVDLLLDSNHFHACSPYHPLRRLCFGGARVPMTATMGRAP